MTSKTLYTWIDQNEEFKQAKDVGFERSFQKWEDIGLQLAEKGSAQVWHINMRNRFGWDMNGEAQTPVNITINADQEPQIKQVLSASVKP